MEKSEKINNYLNSFASTKDFSGQILDQVKLIRKFLTLRRLEPDMNYLIIDALKALEYSLRGLEWNNNIEKEWNRELKKLHDSFEKLDNGDIIPRLSYKFQEAKIYLDYKFLLRMCLDIGIIDRKIAHENSNIRTDINR